MDKSPKVEDNQELLIDIDPGLVMAEALKSFTTPEQIEALEGELLGSSGSTPIPVSHNFCRGIYARTVLIPAGFLAIGHSHSDECLNIVASGSVSVVIDGEV